MSKPLLTLAVLVAVGLLALGDNLPLRAPARIELNDQFGMPQTIDFPSTNITVLAIADSKGSEEVAGWISPIKQRFGTNLVIRGIADVSGVPGFLKGRVQKRFQQQHTNSVMLDWSGVVCAEFQFKRGVANLFALDRNGFVRGHFTGVACATNVNMATTLLAGLISNSIPDQTPIVTVQSIHSR